MAAGRCANQKALSPQRGSQEPQTFQFIDAAFIDAALISRAISSLTASRRYSAYALAPPRGSEDRVHLRGCPELPLPLCRWSQGVRVGVHGLRSLAVGDDPEGRHVGEVLLALAAVGGAHLKARRRQQLFRVDGLLPLDRGAPAQDQKRASQPQDISLHDPARL